MPLNKSASMPAALTAAAAAAKTTSTTKATKTASFGRRLAHQISESHVSLVTPIDSVTPTNTDTTSKSNGTTTGTRPRSSPPSDIPNTPHTISPQNTINTSSNPIHLNSKSRRRSSLPGEVATQEAFHRINNRRANARLQVHLSTHRDLERLTLQCIATSLCSLIITILALAYVPTNNDYFSGLQLGISVVSTLLVTRHTRWQRIDIGTGLIPSTYAACLWMAPIGNPVVTALDWTWRAQSRDEDTWPRSRYYCIGNTVFVSFLFYAGMCAFKWLRLTQMDKSERNLRHTRGAIPRAMAAYALIRVILQQVFVFDTGCVPCVSWIAIFRVPTEQLSNNKERGVLICVFNAIEVALLLWIVREARRAKHVFAHVPFVPSSAALAAHLAISTFLGWFAANLIILGIVVTAFSTGVDNVWQWQSDDLELTGVQPLLGSGVAVVLLVTGTVFGWMFTPINPAMIQKWLATVAVTTTATAQTAVSPRGGRGGWEDSEVGSTNSSYHDGASISRHPSVISLNNNMVEPFIFTLDSLFTLWNLSFTSHLTGDYRTRLSNDEVQSLIEDPSIVVVEQIVIQSANTYVMIAESPDAIYVVLRARSASLSPRLQSGLGFLSAYECKQRLFPIHSFAVPVAGRLADTTRVHSGILRTYETVRDPLIALVATLVVQQLRPVYITGHQIGGGLATIAGLDLALHAQLPEGYLKVVSFGSPRIGNLSFCRLYERMLPRGLINVNNAGDAWESLPGNNRLYRHAGSRVWMDRIGDLVLNADQSERAILTRTHKQSLSSHTLAAYTLAIIRVGVRIFGTAWWSSSNSAGSKHIWSAAMDDLHHQHSHLLNAAIRLNDGVARCMHAAENMRGIVGRAQTERVIVHVRVRRVSGLDAGGSCVCVVACGLPGISSEHFWEKGRTVPGAVHRQEFSYTSVSNKDVATASAVPDRNKDLHTTHTNMSPSRFRVRKDSFARLGDGDDDGMMREGQSPTPNLTVTSSIALSAMSPAPTHTKKPNTTTHSDIFNRERSQTQNTTDSSTSSSSDIGGDYADGSNLGNKLDNCGELGNLTTREPWENCGSSECSIAESSEADKGTGIDSGELRFISPVSFSWPEDAAPLRFGDNQLIMLRHMQLTFTILDTMSSGISGMGSMRLAPTRLLGSTKIYLRDLHALAETEQNCFGQQTIRNEGEGRRVLYQLPIGQCAEPNDDTRLEVEIWTTGGVLNGVGVACGSLPNVGLRINDVGVGVGVGVATPMSPVDTPSSPISLLALNDSVGGGGGSDIDGVIVAAALPVRGGNKKDGYYKQSSNTNSNRHGVEEEQQTAQAVMFSKTMVKYYLAHSMHPKKDKVVLHVGLMRIDLNKTRVNEQQQDEHILNNQLVCHVKTGLESASSSPTIDISNPEWNQVFVFGRHRALTGFEDVSFSLKRGDQAQDGNGEWVGKARIRLSRLLLDTDTQQQQQLKLNHSSSSSSFVPVSANMQQPLVRWLPVKSVESKSKREMVVGHLCAVFLVSIEPALKTIPRSLMSDDYHPMSDSTHLHSPSSASVSSSSPPRRSGGQWGFETGPPTSDMSSDINATGLDPEHAPGRGSSAENTGGSRRTGGLVPLMRQKSNSLIHRVLPHSKGVDTNAHTDVGEDVSSIHSGNSVLGGSKTNRSNSTNSSAWTPFELTLNVPAEPASLRWVQACAEPRDERTVVLTIRVIQASLPEVFNCFCTLNFSQTKGIGGLPTELSELRRSTSVIRSSSSPVWDEKFVLGRERNAPVRGTEDLVISFWHWENASTTQLLGSVNLGLSPGQHVLEVELENREESFTAQLELSLVAFVTIDA